MEGAALGAIAAVRPLLEMAGVLDAIGQPLGAIGATVAISLVWILAVGLTRVPHRS